MSRWTADDIPDLTGRTAVVTGANSGIGLQTALQLARRGATVVLGCRDPERGGRALEQAAATAAAGSPRLGLLDLADLSSVRDFAAEVQATEGGVDVLVNNAGVMAVPYRRTADGFEMQLGTNHLGHFALTGLLLPALLDRPGARVVTVSSTAHRIGRIRFDDLQSERRYEKWTAYGQSKLANLLFAFELDRRARAAGVDLTSVAAHPGYAATNLQSVGPRMSGNRVMGVLTELANRLVAQSDIAGALPSLRAATAPDVRGGEYFGPDGPFETRGHPTRVGCSRAARDEAAARRLWDVSAELTGVDYGKLAG